jgi:quinol monooxygenase YgiN
LIAAPQETTLRRSEERQMTETALTGWIAIPAAEQDRLLPLLEDHIRLTRAEPGCLAFSVTRSPEHPERFDVVERFRDRDAFLAHQQRSAASPWGEATRHLQRDYRIEDGPSAAAAPGPEPSR